MSKRKDKSSRQGAAPSLEELRRMLEAGRHSGEGLSASGWEDDPLLTDALEGLALVRDKRALGHRLKRISEQTQNRLYIRSSARDKRTPKRRYRATPINVLQIIGSAAAAVALLLVTFYVYQSLSDAPALAEQRTEAPASDRATEEREVLSPPAIASGQAAAESSLAQAVELYASGAYQEALPLLQQALAHDPDNRMGHYYLAMTHLQLEAVDAAIAQFTWLIERPGPFTEAAQWELGRLYVQQGEREEGLLLLRTLAGEGGKYATEARELLDKLNTAVE